MVRVIITDQSLRSIFNIRLSLGIPSSHEQRRQCGSQTATRTGAIAIPKAVGHNHRSWESSYDSTLLTLAYVLVLTNKALSFKSSPTFPNGGHKGVGRTERNTPVWVN